MSNIKKIQSLYHVRPHKAKIIADLFQNHLSYGYAVKVAAKAKEKGLITTPSEVRHVKSLTYANQEILELLIELAKENQLTAEKGKDRLDELLN